MIRGDNEILLVEIGYNESLNSVGSVTPADLICAASGSAKFRTLDNTVSIFCYYFVDLPVAVLLDAVFDIYN